MKYAEFFQDHPLMLVVTDLRGRIVECSPLAEDAFRLVKKTLMQEYFYETDALKVMEILQSCEPIVGETFRIEVQEGVVRHVRCTVRTNGDRLTWSFQDIQALVETQQRLQTLKMLPKEYGHEINNFLTVIGSAAEGIKMDATEPLLLEDAEAILSMTERAAVLTRRFMHLGRKSLLPSEIVSVAEMLELERDRLERLIGQAFRHINIHDDDASVYASQYVLRNIWMAVALCFENKDCSVDVSVQHVSYHFASKVLGLPSGTYVVMSVFEAGFPHSASTVLSTRQLVNRELDDLQGAWEGLTRSRGGLCQHESEDGRLCVSLFLPWVRKI